MRYLWTSIGAIALGLLIASTGCKEADSPPASSTTGKDEARKPPEFGKAPAGENADMDKLMAEAMKAGQGDLPPGHPPIGATTMPAGHPPIDSTSAGPLPPGATLPAGHPPIGQAGGAVAFSGDMAPPEQSLRMTPPASWQSKPARPMTVAVYGLPQAAEGGADAELTISHYPGMKNIPLQTQVDRWAGQFKQPAGQADGALKQSKLENAAHPTTLVDVSGTYQSGGMMMGADAAPRDDYRMMVAVIETDQGPWFLKLVGPKATVSAHEGEFLKFVREAK